MVFLVKGVGIGALRGGIAGAGGVGAKKFYNGTQAWTTTDQTDIMNKFQNASKQFT